MKSFIALLATLLLAACGAAGGLYLPNQPHKHDGPLHKKNDGQTGTQPATPDGNTVAAPADPATPPQTNQP